MSSKKDGKKLQEKKLYDSIESAFDIYELAIQEYCDELAEKLLVKYRKGKLEHGGLPVKLNCRKEIAMEVLDILIYHQIDKVNERLRKNGKSRSARK